MTMKRPYYIFSSGRIRRQQNTLFFERAADPEISEQESEDVDAEVLVDADFEPETGESGKVDRRVVPVEDVEALYCFGEMTLNSKLIHFLARQNIVAHFFNYYGFYSSSLVPRDYLVSGEVLVRQVEHYLDPEKRMRIAREFVLGAADNILNNLKYYNNRGLALEKCIETVEKEIASICDSLNVTDLMAAEGRLRNAYYAYWDLIIGGDFTFERRSRRPPHNAVNALISFGNTMLYTTVLGEVYHTQLNPTVSFLHEPGSKRFSLCLDIAEVFKPFIVDRLVFSLLNKKNIQEKHFDEKLNFCYLNEEGRKIFVKAYDERMKTTIKHRSLGRNVSYRRLIRIEAYKLIKHLTAMKNYSAFRMWW